MCSRILVGITTAAELCLRASACVYVCVFVRERERHRDKEREGERESRPDPGAAQ